MRFTLLFLVGMLFASAIQLHAATPEDKAAGKVKEGADSAADAIGKVREKAKEQASRLKRSAEDLADDAKDAANRGKNYKKLILNSKVSLFLSVNFFKFAYCFVF